MSSEEPTDEVQPLQTTSPVVPPAPPERGAPSDQQTEIRKELGDFERISIRIQRRVLYATWAIAAITGVYVFVTFRQWRTMQDQLGVMSSQFSDARNAAVEANNATTRQLGIADKQAGSLKTLAEQTTSQAAQTKSLAEQTTSLASAARDSAIASNRQWHEMQQQVGLMRDQLVDTRNSAKDSADAIGRQLAIADTQAGSIKTLADATALHGAHR